MKRALLLLVVLSVHAHALADEPVTREVFLARADEVALERASTELGADVARARIASARTRPMPRVEIGLAQVDVSGQGAPTSSSLGVVVPVEIGARSRRVSYAEVNAAVIAADADVLRLAFRRDADLAFVAALEADAELALERRALATFEGIVDASARRFARNDLTRGELVDAELAAARARVRVTLAEGRLRERRALLAVFVAEPRAEMVPSGTLDAQPRTLDEDALSALALASRPELASIDLAIERALVEARIARNSLAPTLELSATWTHNGRTSEPQFAQHSNDTLALLVGLPLPSPARASASLEIAHAEQARWTAAATQRRNAILVETRTAIRSYEAARDALAVYTSTVAATIAERRRIVERAFEAGEVTLFERLDVARRAHELDLEMLHARADHERALVRLGFAVGAPASFR